MGSRFLGRFQRWVDKTSWLGERFAAIVICVQAVVVTWGVVLTYVFKSSDVFSVEISSYLLVLLCFASVAFVAREDRHVIVDVFVQLLPFRIQQIFKVIAYGLTVIFCVILTWKATGVTFFNYQKGFRSASLVNLPLWIPYLIISLGSLLLTLQYIVETIKIASGIRQPPESE